MDQGVSVLGGSLIYTLIFLLPGLIGTALYRLLAEGRKMSTFDLLTFSLLLTLAGNGLAHVAVGVSLLPDIDMAGDRAIMFSYANFTFGGLAASTAASAIIALGFTLITKMGLLYRLAQKSRVTFKTGRINVWHDVFHDNRGQWVNVTFKDGTSIIGWPRYYSVDEERFEIFLADAMIRQPVKNTAESSVPAEWIELEVTGPGVYINNFDEIQYVAMIGEQANG